MVDKHQSNDMKPGTTEAGTAATPRSSGAVPAPRNAEARDAMADMAERAQVIGQEASSKITAAMKDVIGAAAGLAGFAVESARDLVQYMVRRGQISQDEADRLIREAEDVHGKRPPPDRGRSSGPRMVGDRAVPVDRSSRPGTGRVERAPAGDTSTTARSAAPAKTSGSRKAAPASASPKAGGKPAAKTGGRKTAKKSLAKKRR
jgi:polyhydroxyalkanoate synthesis regulator phasin